MKQSVSPAMAAGLLIVVLAIIGLVAYKMFVPEKPAHVSGSSGNAAYDQYQKTGRMPAGVNTGGTTSPGAAHAGNPAYDAYEKGKK